MQEPSPRVALIHATALSVPPILAAFDRHWPQAQRMNLLDDSLSVDRAAAGELTPAMVQRFVDLARYAQGTGCRGILFSCSAFGPAIEAAGRATGLPTLKPNEAMFDQALAVKPDPVRLGLVATFQASLGSMGEELQALARARGRSVDLRTVFVPEAMDDLAQGRADEHHRKIAAAARAVADCDAVMLAQFSMAAAQPLVQKELPCPVLTSPDCAVLALQKALRHA
ncbi:aspartate/glutamate racemase family protein [Ramlibacter sp. XY19]|uniref:aspartate/glutamate racemase family protein n=1 Tax=Ramlibacter paludis TaxID=2908000 RepID=UPI0023DADBE8|nr:aspartate/glutamate racemase family protein [Ramlibacter paludis]MCG2594210.1 aspartate/glutamate racemase family protein [Ramlibacter paludis]